MLITQLILISTVFTQSKMNINNLVQYGEKMYKTNDDKPYKGKVFDLYESTGKKKFEGYFLDGLKNSRWTYWNDKGVKQWEKIFKKGTYDYSVYYDSDGKRYKGIEKIEENNKSFFMNDFSDGCFFILDSIRLKYYLCFSGGEIKGNSVYWSEDEIKYEGKSLNSFDSTFTYKNDVYNFFEFDEVQISSHGSLKNNNEDGKWSFWWFDDLDNIVYYKYCELSYENGILNGLGKTWYENGRKSGEGVYEKGISNWMKFSPTGTRSDSTVLVYKNLVPWEGINIIWKKYPWWEKIKEEYKNGKKDGIWLELGEYGKIIRKGMYKSGEKDGVWIYKQDTTTYKIGTLDGLYTEYKYGTPLIRGYYKDGKRDSLWSWYNDDDHYLEETKNYKNGILIENKKYYYYYSNRRESGGTIVNGEKNGFWKEWWGNGEKIGFKKYELGQKKSEGNYENGKKEGEWISWSPDGIDSTKLVYKDGLPFEGVKINWNEEDKKDTEETYQNGKLNGKWIKWSFWDGYIETEGMYKNGIKSGLWRTWKTDVSDGGSNTYKITHILITRGHFKEGLKNGLWIYSRFDKIYKYNYSKGSYVSKKIYSAWGDVNIQLNKKNLMFEGVYENGVCVDMKCPEYYGNDDECTENDLLKLGLIDEINVIKQIKKSNRNP